MHQDKSKAIFDKREKEYTFFLCDLVLRSHPRREEIPNQGKFDILWFGPFQIFEVLNKNTFILKYLDGNTIIGGPVNGHILNNFFIH